MRYWHLPCCLLVITLSSCDIDVEVKGMLGDNDRLTGSLTRSDDGGTVELFSDSNAHCVGSFQYRRKDVLAAGGTGALICDDRRSGPFSFTLRGTRHGDGWGTLDGVRYHFSF